MSSQVMMDIIGLDMIPHFLQMPSEIIIRPKYKLNYSCIECIKKT